MSWNKKSHDGHVSAGNEFVHSGADGMDTPDGAPPGESKSCGKKCCSILKSNIFLLCLLAGIIVGVGLGLGIRKNHPEFREDKRNLLFLKFPGELFMRMLKMCIIPLIVSSLMSGVASIPTRAMGKLGGFAVLYYLITTLMSVLLGILLVATIKPGSKGKDLILQDKDVVVNPWDSLLDLIRNAFPKNIIGACVEATKTAYTWNIDTVNVTFSNSTGNYTYEEEVREITSFRVITQAGTNVLGLCVFSITIGVIIGRMGYEGLPVKNFVDSFQKAILIMIGLIIWFTPIGICFLMAERIVAMEDPARDFQQLGWYMMTVLVGLFIHGFVVLPGIYLLFTRKNPFKLMYHMLQALFTALGTASSSATLPVTMRCLEEKAGVDSRVSRFVLPVGATINMDGTALYEAVASIFIAQTEGISMSAGKYVIVSITATAAAIGAAGVPEAGLVTMVIVLTALGLPTDKIGLILAIDWFLDRFRTSLNVWGDSVGAGVVEQLATSQLEKMDREDALALNNNEQRPSNASGRLNPSYVHDPYEDEHKTRL